MIDRDMRTECWDCKHKRDNSWTNHIACANPSIEVLRNGNAHGKKNGWFFYPLNFDPVWKDTFCPNYESAESAINPAISLAVSQETSEPKTS